MFLFAFHAFARIGKITENTFAHKNPNNLQLANVNFVKIRDTVALTVNFVNYKQSTPGRNYTICIEQNQGNNCPVQAMTFYLKVRGKVPGPLFCNQDGQPVLRSQFTSELNTVLSFCWLNPALYKGHSFRNGAATSAAERGLSDAQIPQLGRWRSNAFHKYIRVTTQ